MRKISLVLAFFSLVISCSRVPVTGRRQLDLIPNSQIMELANTSYRDFLRENRLSDNAEQTALVKRVGNNIAHAVEDYMKSIHQSKELRGYKWEFNLIEDPAINAWAMPGGKVVFYTGILPVTRTEQGLAVVMGHEVAHAVAKHGNERMSQALTAQLGGVALQVALRDKPQQTRELFYAAYGVGTAVGILLPYSRLQESEADRIGLIFMAMAGYNPNEAIDFWERMQAAQQGAAPPEFLSTHPGHGTRIQDIRKHLPEAMRYYNAAISKK